MILGHKEMLRKTQFCLLQFHNYHVTSKTRTARDYSNISNYSKIFNLIISDVNECSQGSHGCHANATCNNTQGSYNCTCRGGYVGSGKYCKVKGGSYLREKHFILESICLQRFCACDYIFFQENIKKIFTKNLFFLPKINYRGG